MKNTVINDKHVFQFEKSNSFYGNLFFESVWVLAIIFLLIPYVLYTLKYITGIDAKASIEIYLPTILFLSMFELLSLKFAYLSLIQFIGRKILSGIIYALVFILLQSPLIGSSYIAFLHQRYEMEINSEKSLYDQKLSENMAHIVELKNMMEEKNKNVNTVLNNINTVVQNTSYDLNKNWLDDEIIGPYLREQAEMQKRLSSEQEEYGRAKNEVKENQTFTQWMSVNFYSGVNIMGIMIVTIVVFSSYAFEFFLVKRISKSNTTSNLPDFNLEILESIPASKQVAFAERIIPSLHAFIKGWQAADILTISRRNLLDDFEKIENRMSFCIELKNSIQNCKITPETKKTLMHAIDSLSINEGELL